MTEILPMLTEGPFAGCFLVNVVDVSIPSPHLPKIVQDTWSWQGNAKEATLNSLWVAVEASWVKARMADRKMEMSDALYDIINLFGLSSDGEKEGLKMSQLKGVKKKVLTMFQMLYHDGSGFEERNRTNPAVLVIKRQGMADKPVLAIVGHPKDTAVSELGKAANLIALPSKTKNGTEKF